MLPEILTVPPYCGKFQAQSVPFPPGTYPPPEDGPKGVVPYAILFPEALAPAWLPPPLSKTEIWSAQMTWPLPQSG